MKISKRDSTVILNALTGGVVPSRGLQYIMVGRVKEAQQVVLDLNNVKNGASLIKFFIGPFGSGKSFIQALTKQIALKERFIVTAADFESNKRLYGSEGKASALYTQLMNNICSPTMPEGGALSTLLEKWINDIQIRIVKENGYEDIDYTNKNFVQAISTEIMDSISKLDTLTGGYDFSRILVLYFKGFLEDNEQVQKQALKWLKGEYSTKIEARQDLGVRSIINDENYYDYLKVFTQFFKQIGYSGFVINLDEAINLYKINHAQAREKNYEAILKIYNDTLQSTLTGLYITFGGTVEFLEDERKGLYSYGALKRRLEVNAYETANYRDLSQPVIMIKPLEHNEIYGLLEKLRDIHAIHYKYDCPITDQDIMAFMQNEFGKMGAANNLTVGNIIKRFLGILNILHQNPELDKKIILVNSDKNQEPTITTNTNSRFTTSTL